MVYLVVLISLYNTRVNSWLDDVRAGIRDLTWSKLTVLNKDDLALLQSSSVTFKTSR